MLARIYRPAKTAMQSGNAKTHAWVLEYEPASPRVVEPLMGWTSSTDTRQQLRLRFASAQDAIAYCQRNAVAYRVDATPATPPVRRVISYADNFAFTRRAPWTH
ncbi:MAG: ETC complex I subunit [Proteobacteria bacterium]|nr:ETC complex I subunit [Pseudomonadota bacterium]